MSIYRPESQVSQLNRTHTLLAPDPLLVEVLQHAQDVSQRTAGAFDITVQPLWELYADRQRNGTLPADAEIREARALVDWRQVEVSANRIQLLGHGTKITLNGIAQGFAADRVTHVLRSHGIEHALIDTGEIGTLGSKPPKNGWTIGIQHPRDASAYCSLVELNGRCLATSGDYATSFSRDHRHHHLFDPQTGHSPSELSSVSIAAPLATEADALSTAVFVLGREHGMSLIQQTPGVDGMLIDKAGSSAMSAGFPVA